MSADLAELNDSGPPAGHAPAGPGLLTVLWRRKAYLVFGAVIGLGLGYLDYLRRERVYQSTAQLFVQKRRADPVQVVGPVGSAGPADSRVAFIEDFLATQEALIRSAEVLNLAAKHLARAPLEQPPVGGDYAGYIGSGLAVSRVQTGSGTAANILNISFKGPSAADCVTAVEAVISGYRDAIEGGVATATRADIDQIAAAKRAIAKDLEDLDREFAAAHGEVLKESKVTLPDLKARINLNEAKKSDLQLRQKELRARLDRVADARSQKLDPRGVLALLRRARERDGDRPAGPRAEDPAADGQLAGLRGQLEELSQTFGGDHPQVAAVRRRIERLERERPPGGRPAAGAAGVEDEIRLLVLERTQEVEEIEAQVGFLEAEVLTKDRAVVERLEGLQFTETTIGEKRDKLRKRLAELEDKERQIELTKQNQLFEARTINPPAAGTKVAPVLLQSLVMAIALGLAGGGGLAYLAELTDKSFRTPDEIRRRLGLAVVGHIPALPPGLAGAITGPVDARVVVHHKPKSTEAEAYRGVRTALYFSTRGKGHQVIQVTSPNPGDGKSTLSANLAVAIAQSGKRVVLIDCDFRKPRVHKIFGISPDVGLASVIAGDATLEQATQESGVPNLSLLPCGPRPANPAELLTSQRFAEVLDTIKTQYDFVLIDTPPLLAVSDPAVVAPRVDGVLLTIRITSRTRPAAERATETLSALGVNVVGVVVNDLQGAKRNGAYGYGYGYGYSYGYGYRYQYNYAYGYAENYGDAGDESGEHPAVPNLPALPPIPTGNGPGPRHLN